MKTFFDILAILVILAVLAASFGVTLWILTTDWSIP